uniref:Uncharacterized protein n=1 Tax=Romanomermis culicivorax TaxID=13658 RepID=A0A915IMP5_ROMCU
MLLSIFISLHNLDVLAFLVAEIFGDRQAGQSDAGPGAGRFVHLTFKNSNFTQTYGANKSTTLMPVIRKRVKTPTVVPKPIGCKVVVNSPKC